MANVKISLNGLGEFECTGSQEFIDAQVEKFYAAIWKDTEKKDCTGHEDENTKSIEEVGQHGTQPALCKITKKAEADPELAHIISMRQNGEFPFHMGDILSVTLKDSSQAAFVMTQEDEVGYRFESVDCIGGKPVAYNKIKELFENYIGLLPDVLVKNMILTNRKYCDRNGDVHERESLLFLPSAPEVFPKVEVCGDTGLYEQMEWYKDYHHRMRKLTADREKTFPWWLGSAYASIPDNFCFVHSNGLAGAQNTSATWLGAPVCFRIRKFEM